MPKEILDLKNLETLHCDPNGGHMNIYTHGVWKCLICKIKRNPWL